jgi:hypothetical protein
MEVLEARFALRLWAYIGLLQGLCGAVVLGIVSALWSLAQGEWYMALATPLLLPCFALSSLVTAIAGFPVYSWLCKQRAAALRTSPTERPGNGGA